jgi:hypothetical protein
MYSVVRVKEGVLFSKIAPGGFRILSAIEQVCRKLNYGDFTITSACDGVHSGPTDPHPEGKAYDVRSHNFLESQKPIILNALQALLPSDEFYCFLEKPGTPDEHWHCQVKKGTEYPPFYPDVDGEIAT